MEYSELVRTRRSVRTFNGQPLTTEDLGKLTAYAASIGNPYGIPVEFVFLDAAEHGLSSPVIKGETAYVAGKAGRVPHAEEAFGYSFEKLVLYAWSLGVGTTIIGGTMKRDVFEREAGLKPDERMYCVSPLGYPAERMSVKETAMRLGVRAGDRMSAEKLFFDGAFGTPLTGAEGKLAEALEAVRLAPSAVNRQPWRIVRTGADFHFYLRHEKGYVSEAAGDMQKIDLGIALCHFMGAAGGTFSLRDPGLPVPADTEYIATVTL